MTINEIIKVINGNIDINDDKLIEEIKTDTRNINKGDIFIALKGKNYDGNDFIDEALKKGASFCISDKVVNDKCILVNDTYEALYLIGKYMREKYNIPLIAVTGSNGKTTTKDLIYHILSSKYNVLKNEESKNNLIGVSDTLFKLNNKYEIIVIELGTNHLGEISYLSNMCKPNVSIITNIGSSHLEFFKKRKNIFKEKISIKDGMDNVNLIVNGDDKYLRWVKGYKCGIKNRNNLKAYNIKESIDSISFNIYLDKEYKIKFNNPGKHFIIDILLAIKVCLDYGINIKTIIRKINSFNMVNKRMNIINLKNNILINDCYNSSLESIKGGLDYIKNIKGNKILIIGDILELGKYSKRIHKKINKLVKVIEKKEVYTIGNYSKYIKGKHFNNSFELLKYLENKKIDNSYIYVKGSRRMNLDIVVDYIIKK